MLILIHHALSLTLPHERCFITNYLYISSKTVTTFFLLIALLHVALEEVLDVEVAPEAEPEPEAEPDEELEPEPEVHEEGM